MSIPLEDTVEDILDKAQRGLGLTDETLAQRLNLDSTALQRLATFSSDDLGQEEALARLLQLDSAALRVLAAGRYQPLASPPTRGFYQANTAYGEMRVNAYLVWDPVTRFAAAFDTGGDCTPLLDRIASERLTLQDVYLTHTHADHLAELDRLIEEAGGSVGVHVSAAEPVAGAALFAPGLTFNLGKLQIESRDTAGHSPGGTSYHIHGLDAPLTLVGDALFAGSIGGVKTGYAAALQRIRDHLLNGQDNTTLAPGHGPLTTVKLEKAHNPFFPEFKQAVASGI